MPVVSCCLTLYSYKDGNQRWRQLSCRAVCGFCSGLARNVLPSMWARCVQCLPACRCANRSANRSLSSLRRVRCVWVVSAANPGGKNAVLSICDWFSSVQIATVLRYVPWCVPRFWASTHHMGKLKSRRAYVVAS